MSGVPANWYPDPTGRHELRYWDGQVWSEHVSDDGVTAHDPVDQGSHDHLDDFDNALSFGDEARPEDVQRQLRDTGFRGAGIREVVSGGGGTILDEPILVVNQRAKLVELSQSYAVMDQHGNQIAHVRQIGQTTAQKTLRLLPVVDQFMTHKLQIASPSGQPLLLLTRPAKMLRSTVIVADAHDRELGRIVQENVVGRIHFVLQSHGQRLGAIRAENWRAWNFRIEDAVGTEVARITKTFPGFMKAAFTTADNYVVQIHARQPEPLNRLIVASALSIDTALKQDIV